MTEFVLVILGVVAVTVLFAALTAGGEDLDGYD
jgi:hypothetical protein